MRFVRFCVQVVLVTFLIVGTAGMAIRVTLITGERPAEKSERLPQVKLLQPGDIRTNYGRREYEGLAEALSDMPERKYLVTLIGQRDHQTLTVQRARNVAQRHGPETVAELMDLYFEVD